MSILMKCWMAAVRLNILWQTDKFYPVAKRAFRLGFILGAKTEGSGYSCQECHDWWPEYVGSTHDPCKCYESDHHNAIGGLTDGAIERMVREEVCQSGK